MIRKMTIRKNAPNVDWLEERNVKMLLRFVFQWVGIRLRGFVCLLLCMCVYNQNYEKWINLRRLEIVFHPILALLFRISYCTLFIQKKIISEAEEMAQLRALAAPAKTWVRFPAPTPGSSTPWKSNSRVYDILYCPLQVPSDMWYMWAHTHIHTH